MTTEEAHAQACQASCGQGSDIEVNLQARCMCLKGGECFKIDIGKNGPSMTTSGTGVLKGAAGAKFSTKKGAGTNSYDNDAISTGISQNDAVGKWIHKTQARTTTGRNSTKGCIGVPLDKWTLVKKAAGLENASGPNDKGTGKRITVCGSGGKVNSSGGGGSGSGGGSTRRSTR